MLQTAGFEAAKPYFINAVNSEASFYDAYKGDINSFTTAVTEFKRLITPEQANAIFHEVFDDSQLYSQKHIEPPDSPLSNDAYQQKEISASRGCDNNSLTESIENETYSPVSNESDPRFQRLGKIKSLSKPKIPKTSLSNNQSATDPEEINPAKITLIKNSFLSGLKRNLKRKEKVLSIALPLSKKSLSSTL